MLYSAVTQPVPRPRIHGGTRSSNDAAQITRVSPTLISTLPSAFGMKSGLDRNRAQLRRPLGRRGAAHYSTVTVFARLRG